MAWQDLVFLGGSLLTVVALLPALRDVDARIPLETSLPKFALAVVYVGTFYSLGMTLSAAGLLATAVMWSLVAWLRSPTGSLLSVRSLLPSVDRSAAVEPNDGLGQGGDQF